MIINLFKPDTLKRVRRIFEKNKVTYAGVFGSYAKNEAKANSDVDFLIEFEPESKKPYLIWLIYKKNSKPF